MGSYDLKRIKSNTLIFLFFFFFFELTAKRKKKDSLKTDTQGGVLTSITRKRKLRSKI